MGGRAGGGRRQGRRSKEEEGLKESRSDRGEWIRGSWEVGWAVLVGFCPKLGPLAACFSFSFRDISGYVIFYI